MRFLVLFFFSVSVGALPIRVASTHTAILDRTQTATPSLALAGSCSYPGQACNATAPCCNSATCDKHTSLCPDKPIYSCDVISSASGCPSPDPVLCMTYAECKYFVHRGCCLACVIEDQCEHRKPQH